MRVEGVEGEATTPQRKPFRIRELTSILHFAACERSGNLFRQYLRGIVRYLGEIKISKLENETSWHVGVYRSRDEELGQASR